MASRDGGRTWTQSGSLPEGGTKPTNVRELTIDRADGALVALMHNGTLLRSTDEGKTWMRDL
jgi:photosystem II stability/assembly factor-like uncharacterized protein